MEPLEIQRVRVRRGALDIEVAAALETLHVTRSQASSVLAMFPNLARHVCVNERDDGHFASEIVGTELPHLLEHLIIELQARADKEEGVAPRSYSGHTSWLEELECTGPEGFALMRVTVSFADDFVALRALKDALAVIARIATEAPDVPAA